MTRRLLVAWIIAAVPAAGCLRLFEGGTSAGGDPDAVLADLGATMEASGDAPADARGAQAEVGVSDLLPPASPPFDAAQEAAPPDAVEPGPCIQWSAWTCQESVSHDAGTHYCMATCGAFTLVCDPATLDCYCNGTFCGAHIAMGAPCNLCQSSWNSGACCGY
jgi:hypothetical protein